MAPQTSTLRSTCCACGGRAEVALALPRLPLTGIYSREGPLAGFPDYDQEFLVCPACGHGQLSRVLDPASLYGESYGFRTSASASATRGSEFFARYLERIAPGRRFQRVLEIGCSDAVLLRLLRPRAEKLLGIDPVLKGREHEFLDEGIRVMGASVGEVDAAQALGGAPDLVVAQHTLEHLANPFEVLRQLVEIADDEALFLFEVPCLDPLLERLRFDQIFHQHLQYFSVSSLSTLLERLGCEIVGTTFHHTYWGALLAAFRKGRARGGKPASRHGGPEKSVAAIQARFQKFRRQMELCAEELSACGRDELFGYGAALMLPILGYHLGTDFSGFSAILDDDPAKNGIGYANLPVRIRNPADLKLDELTVCLTAMDNRRPILRRLADQNPKCIINPLCYL